MRCDSKSHPSRSFIFESFFFGKTYLTLPRIHLAHTIRPSKRRYEFSTAFHSPTL
jgi:hypothetical protein